MVKARTDTLPLVQRLRRFFERAAMREVLAVFLFGSRAKGTEVPASDIDIGVVLTSSPPLDAAARFDLAPFLTRMRRRQLQRLAAP